MDGTNLGILTLIPVVSFFVLAFLTKKCILSIVILQEIDFLDSKFSEKRPCTHNDIFAVIDALYERHSHNQLIHNFRIR